MGVKALGYVGVGTSNLEEWSQYATGLLGLQKVDKSRSSLAFRMDDRKQRIAIKESKIEGIEFTGWEVSDADALQSLAALLEKSGVPVSHADKALTDERHVMDLIYFLDPIGNRVEVFHGAAVATEAFAPGRAISGFRTGVNGLGHIVYTVDTAQTVKKMTEFYIGLLGFRLTDYYSEPFEARFLHVNPRHHSLAIIQTGTTALHHLMMELYSFDDVGQGYDIAVKQEDRIAATLGRHTSDFMTSFYAWTPSQFMIEYGWGGRAIDPDSWKAFERREGPSLWGHERHWASEEFRAKARDMRLANGESGLRAPIQVMQGNFELMDGACPWWDGNTAKK